jgi:SOS response regulatory protein OraA/RecX
LIVSKYVAGRERDLEFASEAIKQGLVQKGVLRERISMLQVEKSIKDRILKRISK